MEEYTFYCDESGNVGSNFFEGQPFYVAGGIALKQEHEEPVKELYDNFKKLISPPKDDLKFSDLKKNARRLRQTYNFLLEVFNEGGIPVTYGYQNSFVPCWWIVENLYDSVYNSKTIIDRLSLVNALYDELPTTALKNYSQVYRRTSYRDFIDDRNSCHLFITDKVKGIVQAINKNMPAQFSFMLEDLRLKDVCAEIYDIQLASEANRRWNNHGFSVNFATFCHLLGVVEKIGDQGQILINKIVHDQQASYKDSFEEYVKFSEKLGPCYVPSDGYSELRRGIEHLKCFEMQNDKENIFIQIADLIVGATAHFYSKGLDRTLDRHDIKLFKHCIYNPQNESACFSRAILPWSTARKYYGLAQRLKTR